MITTLRLVWDRKIFRVILFGLMLLGGLNASVYPYQSMIGIDRIGLSETMFSIVLLIASITLVVTSVLVGLLTDQFGHRRRAALICAGLGATGLAAMLIHPGPAAFLLAHGLMIPVNSSLFGQFFALARLASHDLGPERDGVLSTLRAGLSFMFVFTMIFWSVVFGMGASVMAIYISAAVTSAGLVALIWRYWPRHGTMDWPDTPSGINLTAAFIEIAKPRIRWRLACLGCIGAGPTIYMVLVSLVFDASPLRTTSDVALYVGMIAGWEVPFMLILPSIAGRLKRSTLIAWGSGIYLLHLGLMPLLAASGLIWALPILAGMGGAAILTLPIAYFQDLVHGRPGTGAALLALQKVTSDALAAGAFALGTALAGYQTVAIFGVILMLTGALGLMAMDRRAVG